MNFSMFHSVDCCNNQGKLTESSLLYLLGSKSESRDQFYDYVHQNICQGWRRRDLGINTKSAKKVLEGREMVDQCIAGTHLFDHLGDFDVRGYADWIRGREGYGEQDTDASEYCFCRQGCHEEQKYLDECFWTYYQTDCLAKGRAGRRQAQDVN